ncbi:POTRA domain-containing protein, partial [Nostoc sp. NIES-2111]
MIAQNPNPQDLPPDKFNNVPVSPLPSEITPQPSIQEQLLPPPQLPTQPNSGQDDLQTKFQVDQIEVVGSTVFTPEQFAAITNPYLKQEITFADLLKVRDAITKLYTDKGYATTGALIAPQILEAGVVKIQVIEGSLQEIKITGNRRLRTNYIRDRI